jgi:glycosyltransferase involved in cell wall biosynthesis
MKITIVLGAFFPVPPVMGGAVEKSWFALGRAFAARGHYITMISRAMPQFPGEEIVDGVRHLRVDGFASPSSLLWLKILDFIYSLRVRKVLPLGDILVTNTAWLPLLVRDSTRGKLYVHAGRYPKGQMRLYGRAARLQAPSTVVADAIRAEVPSLAHKVVAIPYPQARPEGRPAPVSSRAKIILYVGRVHPEKGVHLLVQAFAALAGSDLAEWKLMIVGSTDSQQGGGGADYLEQLQRSAATVRERVVLPGPIFDDAALAAEFQRARLFVYPSLAARGETFGLAPLEAMTHGCAVLVSALGCFRDFIMPDETGFVFDQNATRPRESLALALREAVADPVRLERVAKAGQLKTAEFSLPRVADQFLADFKSLHSNAERANR